MDAEIKTTETLEQWHGKHATRPSYYKGGGGIDVIDVSQRYDLGFELGNVAKYLVRAGSKGHARPDIEKAAEYCRRWHQYVFHPAMQGSAGLDWLDVDEIVRRFQMTDTRLGNALGYILEAANAPDEAACVRSALALIELELEECASGDCPVGQSSAPSKECAS